MTNKIRPTLETDITIHDFSNFYWLKEELTSFCRKHKLPSSGSKEQLYNRILEYLRLGIISKPELQTKTISKFDWNNEYLSLKTIITDNYRNTENVRKFMIDNIGVHFKFNTMFMKWMKSNIGRTLAEAIVEWQNIHKERKNNKSTIAPQFEYNTYIRDFLNDNLSMTLKDAISYWNIKKNQEGSTKYSQEDLHLI